MIYGIDETHVTTVEKCKYCDEAKPLTDKIYDDGSKYDDNLSVRVDKAIGNRYSLKVRPTQYRNGERINQPTTVLLINYCPMCGRKLEGVGE